MLGNNSLTFLLYLLLMGFSVTAYSLDTTYSDDSLYINAVDFGLSVKSPDNAPALKEAIEKSKSTGLPVLIPSATKPYRLTGDIVLKGNGAMLVGAGGNAHLEFSSGGLVVGELGAKTRGQVLRDLVLSRVDNPGPVILVKTTKKAKHSRFTWNNIHILSSSGDGIVFEGSYLGSITGLWITKCNGTGIVFRAGTEKHSNAAGANSIGFFGGEVQSCDWGVEAADTRSITFTSFAIEGNRKGGIWLHGDNRVFTFNGGYFENNAKSFKGAQSDDGKYTDIRIGDEDWKGKPNRNIHFNNVFFSDGKAQHQTAVWVGMNQKNIVFNSPLFWAYSASPIFLYGGKRNDSMGKVISGQNERPDEKRMNMTSYRSKLWTE